MTTKYDSQLICAECGKPCENEYGNNPFPIAYAEDDARVCDKCNDWLVIPVRLFMVQTRAQMRKNNVY